MMIDQHFANLLAVFIMLNDMMQQNANCPLRINDSCLSRSKQTLTNLHGM